MRPGYFAMPLHPPGADPARTMDDDLVQLATLDRLGYEEAWIGEHFTAQCAKLSDDVGGFGTLLVIAHEWTPRGAWERSMRLLAEDVLPRLSRAGSARSRAAGRGSSRSRRRPRRGRGR